MACCTYCGAYDGNHRDHVIPVSYTSIKREYKQGTTVPSCGECNSLLGDKMFITVAERAAYLNGVYRSRYRRLLNQPDWTDDELEEVSNNIRKSVKTRILMRDILFERLDHIEVVMSELIDNSYKPPNAVINQSPCNDNNNNKGKKRKINVERKAQRDLLRKEIRQMYELVSDKIKESGLTNSLSNRLMMEELILNERKNKA